MQSDHQPSSEEQATSPCVRRNTWKCDCVCFRRTDWRRSLDRDELEGDFLRETQIEVSQLQQVLAATNTLKALPKPGDFPLCECYTYYIPANRRTSQKKTMFASSSCLRDRSLAVVSESSSFSSLTGGPALGRPTAFLRFEASWQVLNCHSASRGR